MFEGWGRVLYRQRWLVLGISLVFAMLAAVWGTGVFSKLSSSDAISPPGSQSQRAEDLAARTFGRSDADVVVLYRSGAMTVSNPAFRDAVDAALAAVPRNRVSGEMTYWSTKAPSMISADRHETYAVLQLVGADDSARQTSYKAIKADLVPPLLARGGVSALVGGTVPTEVAMDDEVTANIGEAESFSLPVLLILLMVIFGSVVAAALPVTIGALAILGALAALRLLTLATTVDSYSVDIATIIGLGLGIDYGLFMVSRFREELHKQRTVEAAVARTVATAGRTIVVSGITVAVALTSLMLFPEVFLRSMGFGGVATVAVDLIAALTVLPALLAVLGHRVNALRIRGSVRRPRSEESGAWYRIAHSVMRRPIVYVTVIVIALLTLGAPFLRVSWGGSDYRTLPPNAQTRVVAEALNNDFPVNSTVPIEALATLHGSVGQPELADYVHRLEQTSGVTTAQVTGVAGNTVRIEIGYLPNPDSAQARQIVAEVRDTPPPGGSVLVGGSTADLVDELDSLGATLPWMALLVAVSTFVLLFLAFGSVVLPLKAIVTNVLSLGATFGAIVWIFQWGHLSGLLRFTPTGSIDPTMPILMIAVIFGLSMDYEVFLLSRIRERYDQTGDTTASIAVGLQRTGGLITSLAFLLIIVVGSFSASGVSFIKLTGVGMIIALIVDASVVRVLLVPAAMRLLGRANWWAPRPLRGLYTKYGLREAEREEPATVGGPS